MKEKIIIIIPTFNESENISQMIETLENDIFPKIDRYNMNILIVDDYSNDGTAEIVKRKMLKYNNIMINQDKKKGLGEAFKRGIKFAIDKMDAGAIIKMDADFQHNPIYILDFIKKYTEGNDYIIGSRFIKGSKVPRNWSLFRKLLSKYGGLLTRSILFFPRIDTVKDVSSGFKLINVKNVLNKIDLSKISDGFCYTTEIMYKALNIGIKITETPIEFELREKGETKMPFSNILTTLRAVLMLRFSCKKYL